MNDLILDIIEICYRKGVNKFVICPGSRSAPLTLALARHPKIKTWVIGDERAAAFTTLGMALQTQETIGLVCTSGTAVLNFAPAVAEAFFQEVSLLVFTADRPAEWIAQQDGQTLYQREVYGKNVKASFEIPADNVHEDTAWFSQRTINEAINLTQDFPKGPVHVNFPLREPLYPKPNEVFNWNREVKIIHHFRSLPTLSAENWQFIQEIWEDSERKLIIAGQHDLDENLLESLKILQDEYEIPVIGDIVSNLHPLPDLIRHQDLMLMNKKEEFAEKLHPDLLITFGKSLISKNLKLFLRKYKPAFHFHIQPAGTPADTFQTLTHHFSVTPAYFFKKLTEDLDFLRFQGGDMEENDSEYLSLWQKADQVARRKLEQTLDQQTFNEFSAVKTIMENLPENSILHLSNSMPVRYANQIAPPVPEGRVGRLVEEVNLPFVVNNSPFGGRGASFFANRGTSGIDGCTSTAVGAARMTEQKVILITGDMAFFYDRNGLWQKDLPKNLRIILLNNHGGGIFRMIDAGNQPEVTEFFETPNPLNAENTAKDFELEYVFCQDAETLKKALLSFYESSDRPKILEIETDILLNEKAYKSVKAVLSE